MPAAVTIPRRSRTTSGPPTAATPKTRKPRSASASKTSATSSKQPQDPTHARNLRWRWRRARHLCGAPHGLRDDLRGERGHARGRRDARRSEEHTSELQSQSNLVCRLLLEKKNNTENSLLHSVRGLYSSRDCMDTWPAVYAIALYLNRNRHLGDASVVLRHIHTKSHSPPLI